MIEIDGKIISTEIFTQKFCCDLRACKGACCILGDAGAPLLDEELEIIKNYYPIFSQFISEKSKKAIEVQGYYVKDVDNERVTPLVDNKECAYVYFEDNIAKCAIEKAYEQKLISFQKPISCHLYPIRTKTYKDFEAVNYHNWEVCSKAIIKGGKNNILLIDFLKEPLIRKFGVKWYNKLIEAKKYFNKKHE